MHPMNPMHPILALINHWAAAAFQCPPHEWINNSKVRITHESEERLMLESVDQSKLDVHFRCQEVTSVTLHYESAYAMASLKKIIDWCSHVCQVTVCTPSSEMTIHRGQGHRRVPASRQFTLQLYHLNRPMKRSCISDILWIHPPCSVLYEDNHGQIIRENKRTGRNDLYLNHLPLGTWNNGRSMLGPINILPYAELTQQFISLWERAVMHANNAFLLYHHIACGMSVEAKYLQGNLRISIALGRVFKNTHDQDAFPDPDELHPDLYNILILSLGNKIFNLRRRLAVSDELPAPFDQKLKDAVDKELTAFALHISTDNLVVQRGGPQCKDLVCSIYNEVPMKFLINDNLIQPEPSCPCVDKNVCIAARIRRRIAMYCNTRERSEEFVLKSYTEKTGCL